jgi:uncharacterized OB-fold protein
MVKCTKCGWLTSAKEEYCQNCGSKLKGSKRKPIQKTSTHQKGFKPENHKLNSYVTDFSPPKTPKPKRKGEWSF